MRTIPSQLQGLYQPIISGFLILWMSGAILTFLLNIAIIPIAAANSQPVLGVDEKSGGPVDEFSTLGMPIIYVDAESDAMTDFSIIEAGGSQIRYYYVEYHDFNSNMLASIVLDDPSGSFSIAFDDEMVFSDSLTVSFSMYEFKTIMVKYAPTTEGPHSATLKHTGDIDSDTPEPVLLNIRGNTPVGLPIELFSFQAKQEQETFVLDWATSVEINNAYFEIEMMQHTDAGFKKIGRVDSRFSNSATIVTYRFRYSHPERAALTYFRLKQVDIDGNFSYSKTIAVQAILTPTLSLQIVPNPFSTFSELHISAAAAGILQTSVTDLNGNLIWHQKVEVHQGANKLILPLRHDLPPGLYILTASDGIRVSQLKLIKN